VADLQELYLQRVRRKRRERYDLLEPWLNEDVSLAEAEAAARADLAAADPALIERYHQLRQWRIDYHTRGAAREIAAEAARRAARTGAPVPGAERYPDAEISR